MTTTIEQQKSATQHARKSATCVAIEKTSVISDFSTNGDTGDTATPTYKSRNRKGVQRGTFQREYAVMQTDVAMCRHRPFSSLRDTA